MKRPTTLGRRFIIETRQEPDGTYSALYLNEEEMSEFVIVRAYGDEPVRLMSLGLVNNGKNVEVMREGGDREKTISPQRRDVFAWDEYLFQQLKAAYDRQDYKVLKDLWKEALRYEPET